MIKNYYLILPFLLFGVFAFSQHSLPKQAVVTKFTTGFKVGDTIEVTCKNRVYSEEKNDYIYNLSSSDKNGTRMIISEKRLKIISPPFSFWKEVWFWDREFPEGPVPQIASKGFTDTKRLLRELAAHDMLLEDNLLEDYVMKLLEEIFGPEEAAFFPLRPYPKILKAQTPFAAGLHDGCMLISTGLLASIYSESELLSVLTAQVGHFLLGHTAVNAQKFNLADDFFEKLFSEDLLTFSTSSWLQYNANPLAPSYQLAGELRVDMGTYAIGALKGIGATYDFRQLREMDALVRKWLVTHRKDPEALSFMLDRQRRHYFFPSPEAKVTSAASVPVFQVSTSFTHLNGRLQKLDFNFSHSENIDVPDPKLDELFGEALAFHAWHEYYLKRYPRALSAASRLIKTEIADAQIYLLKARLLRMMYSSEGYNIKAVALLGEGRKRMVQKMPELHEEEVLLLMRMERWSEANKALNKLDYLLFEMYADDAILAKREWSKRMRRRVKLAEKND